MRIDVRSDSRGGDTIEVATFYIGSRWLGIRAEHVVESVTPEGITIVPGACQFVKGQIIYKNVPTVILDIRSILEEEPRGVDKDTQIIIVQTGKMKIGLLVDGLGEIPEIPMHRVEAPEHLIEKHTRYTDVVIKPDPKSANQEILVVLHPDGLVDCIRDLI
jgi:chemotaxis signal transduction protein